MVKHDKYVESDASNLKFSIFTSKEVRSLSVAKIISPLSFDALGQPLPGGVYDAAMGPCTTKSDPCATCMNNFNGCSGHMGHIELPMTVFNPLFIKTVHSILKMSCLECFTFQLPEHIRQIVQLQLKLIDAGYVIEAQELEMFKSETRIDFTVTKESQTEDKSYFDYKQAECEKMLVNKSTTYRTKNTEALRTSIVKSALIEYIPIKCIECKSLMKKIKSSYGKLVIGLTKFEVKEFYTKGRQDHNMEDPDFLEKIIPTDKTILADECQNNFRKIFEKYDSFFRLLFPIMGSSSDSSECPMDVFFLNVLPVIPPAARPVNRLREELLEHPQTLIYKKIITACSTLKSIRTNMNAEMNGSMDDEEIGGRPKISEESKRVYESVQGDTGFDKLYNSWQELQNATNDLLDSKVEMNAGKGGSFGLKQIIEKKSGIIRMHMMGKRVDFAARTVITPDPNINVDQIGVPEVFAKKLSYPVPVTAWNVKDLRKMVMNGPDVHPGANFIEGADGKKVFIPADSETKRQSLAKLLMTPSEMGIKIVHRHLLNDDVLLLNRQPTLHRPSIQAHKARILKGEKTFRLHYSNCKAYNADFDGDEMNAHFPQNEIGRSEAYNLANVANNYLVPKDGTPLGGLIQDHMISGVRLSMRGKFFNREDYQQLIFQGLTHLRGHIKLLPPTIIKPARLWSGKQVLSTIFINIIPSNQKRINLTSTSKIYASAWQKEPAREWKCGGTPLIGNDMTEAEVVIRNGELIVGVLDKMHYGSTPYCLVHCMYELYGGEAAIQLLTSLTRTFMLFLQWEGFTLGVHDILVVPEADEQRTEIINECREIGSNIAAKTLNLSENVAPEVLATKMEEAYSNDVNFRAILDRAYKSVLDNYTNEINKKCLPAGLISKFPSNNLQLMVQSGAKGSMVNTMQISCLLGQIELEGKRPPLMISGKSLPSFTTFETSPKSGGFIDGRFMTGIQPQDFFFHCMAGREGLIDTAVKTSRSGYLQRCLIKHLEGLNVNYDMTVRDSDNSVVQFMYGEDGMDITRSQFLKSKQMEFLLSNVNVIATPELLEKLENDPELNTRLLKYKKKLRSWSKKNKALLKSEHNRTKSQLTGFQQFSIDKKPEIEMKKPKKLNKLTGHRKIDEKLVKLWRDTDDDTKEEYCKKGTRRPDPSIATFKPDNCFGSVSEYLENLIRVFSIKYPKQKKEIENMMYIKSLTSLANPGEPVGLLAAQSIGEPSTQMTLNTFHFAGRGEMNVTLGIPRLREILMLASSNIKTPSMDIPFNLVNNLPDIAEKLRLRMVRVHVSDVLESISVKSCLKLRPTRGREYILRFNFLPREAYTDKYCVKPKQILKHMNESFFKLMFKAIVKASKDKSSVVQIDSDNPKKRTKKGEEDEEDNYDKMIDQQDPKNSMIRGDDEDSSEDEEIGDGDAGDEKRASKRSDEKDYDEPEDDDEKKDAESDIEDEENHEEDMLDNNDENNIEMNEKDVIESVVLLNEFAQSYLYDTQNYLWCKLTFNLGIKFPNLDLSTLLRSVANKSIIWETPSIRRAITYTQNDRLMLKTDGINIGEMFKFNKILNLNGLYSNDIHCVAATYGIEAARYVIVKEVQNVFKVYGITVDPRHLLLIADYMTFDGTFQPLSRKGIESSSSPLQQMSFEASLQFLKVAAVSGRNDALESPSSRLMVGQPCKSGTGSFKLITPVY